MYAHRFSWLLAGNIIPEGQYVLHAPHSVCGHKNCVNPAHLRLGTHAENMHDMIADGSTLRGTKHPRSKLTEEQVREILKRSGENQRILSEEFGVSCVLINRIINRKCWKWVN
jgi:hypothetical protein